ncbi:class I SAM-dependent methyltransferase [Streptomyces hokutonensis]|uniref:class I SAM-dependent methyltransferase n=1 Tax=Streptomyces hokutonensis TaxID=1306990 RepID=UPI0033D59625
MMTTTGEHAESAYLLGHSPTELDRLVLQARLYDPITTHALRLAGLSSGMRALDVGCGAGDVTLVAAAIVGPTVAVTGIDAAPAALESARARAARRGTETGGGEGVISFREAILPDVTLEEPVDAVIGRLILGHLPARVTALRRLSRLVRPGGIIALQDFDNHPHLGNNTDGRRGGSATRTPGSNACVRRSPRPERW